MPYKLGENLERVRESIIYYIEKMTSFVLFQFLSIDVESLYLYFRYNSLAKRHQ